MRPVTGFAAALLIAGAGLAGCVPATTGAMTNPTLGVVPATWPDYASEAAGPAFSEDGIAALEQAIDDFVTDGHVPGAAGLLLKDGEVISYNQAGVRNVVTGEPITEDTIYRIYSMTKPVTGVALMMLWEEGKFSLDDPITKYIPEFEDLMVLVDYDEDGTVTLEPVERPATMRELMSHTAGFAYGLGGRDPANQAFRDKAILRSPDMETFMERVASVPLLFQPGERWYYSAAVDIQGFLVEHFSGMTFGEFLQMRLFSPLGMTDTGFFVPDEDLDRFSQVFAYVEEHGGLVPANQPQFAFEEDTIGFESGGGGLVSTMGDYARFSQMLVNGGTFNGVQILKPETIELMRTDVLGDLSVTLGGALEAQEAGTLGFGLDFGIVRQDDPVTGVPGGTYFWGGAAGTWFWVDPVNDLTYIGMIQRFQATAGGADYRGTTADLVYDALEAGDGM